MATKQELIEQQNKLQNELDKLKELIEKTPDDTRPRAKNGGTYYYIDDQSRVVRTLDWYEEWDNNRHQIKNYYLAKEECKYIATCKVTKQQLKDLALRLNKGVEIDWGNNNAKYSIKFDYTNNVLCQIQNIDTQCLGAVYCPDENFLKIAIKEIGKQPLIDLIKSGV